MYKCGVHKTQSSKGRFGTTSIRDKPASHPCPNTNIPNVGWCPSCFVHCLWIESEDAWVHAALWWISWVADFSGKQLSHLKDEEDVTMLLVYLEPRNIQHISNRFAKARITHAQARIAHAHRNI